jgi:ketosteroid isomerase-like protein
MSKGRGEGEGASVIRELSQLEHDFMDAVRRRDMAFLERALGEEFTLTTGRPGAEVRARSEWLDVTRERYVIESFAFEELSVHAYGTVGVVRSRYRQAGRMGELDRTAAYRMTDVWVRRDGRWQLVARHSTALEDG